MILICLIISVFFAYIFSELSRYFLRKNAKTSGVFFAFLTCIMFAVPVAYIIIINKGDIVKKQLENICEEIIKEVKEIKDLTKETLPIVAKEYVTYGEVMSLIVLVLSSIGLATGIGIATLYLGPNAFNNENFNGTAALSVILMMISPVILLISLDIYLKFKLQPKTMAIQGVIKAFKGS